MILHQDRIWSAYALGDLDPSFWPFTSWWRSEQNDNAIAMIFTGLSTAILFTCGQAPALEELMMEIVTADTFHFTVQETTLRLIAKRYEIVDQSAMYRMHLKRPGSWAFPPDSLLPRRLTDAHVEALRKLYSDGAQRGEAPDFFVDTMVTQGCFFGIFAGADLVSAAGTHLVSERENVAAVGCVYTRLDHRGQGLGRITTAAVTQALRAANIGTIVLNVKQSNAPAIRVYEALGYEVHCQFSEGWARRVT